MKFEEVLAQVRAGKKFEDFSFSDNSGKLLPLHADCNFYLNKFLEEFHLTPKKIKRYQIIYSEDNGKNFYLTHPNEKYTHIEFINHFKDFRHKRIFHSILKESEQEFDE